ncbi:phosphatase PAP2 family protein [Hoeflea poritis]|uniref:Phosphatase PAP2 family protein n=1 Tax=Hoeflea poritis TaxID=2993659 RepID=A0ABT4VKT8_9HYPH|nr:phosphatase PAP2 family protein [Hoeflea poritis]MDA4845326.1 phosphatase PAP2 family protein [Hoeflea poritis]
MVPNRAYMSALVHETVAVTKSNRILFILIALYALTGSVYVWATVGFSLDPYRVYGWLWLKNYLLIFPVALFGAGAIRIILRLDERRKLAFRHMFSSRRMAHFLAGTVLMLALMPFQATFTAIKNALSVNGFLYDEVQANIDKLIHFDTDPWQLLFRLTDSQAFLCLVEVNYMVVWFVLCFGILYWVAVSPNTSGFRVRYIITFMLVWFVVGNLLAGAFISAGPVYYGHVTGDFARFGDQLELLARNEGHFNAAVKYQNYLWLLRENNVTGLGSGISAFPSVHVALTMMNALFVYEFNRKLGWAFFAYTAFIVFSSVYLAWHYAIDGYVAIPVTLALYYAVRNLPIARPVPQDRETAIAHPAS